jgi:hypothetical protein
MLPRDLFPFPEDLYRVGNSGGPRMDHIRADEIDVVELNGVRFIQANNRGISVFTETGIRQGVVSGWAWKISKTAVLSPELKLHQDRPEHFMLCPIRQMPLDEYKGHIAKLVVHCERAFKVEKRA